MLFLYRYLKHPCHVSCVVLLGSNMSRGGAVCTTESLPASKLLSSASTGRKLVAKCRHPSNVSCFASQSPNASSTRISLESRRIRPRQGGQDRIRARPICHSFLNATFLWK